MTRRGGRGPGELSDRVGAYLGAALLALVVGTILVTLVLLLVRHSATPTAVGLLRSPAQVTNGVGLRSPVSGSTADSIRVVQLTGAVG